MRKVFIKTIDIYNFKGIQHCEIEFDKKETIIKRLCELKIDSKTLLHLDLLETNKAILMQDFLFSLLILHYYSYEDQYFVLDPEVVLKIEVPYGFFNFIDKYPILKLFKKTTITKENKPQMIVSNDILSDIQIVCNYLKYTPYIHRK